MRPINNAQHRTSRDVNGALTSLMPNTSTWYCNRANGWRHRAPAERRFSSARRCCRRKDVSRQTCQTATQCETGSSRDDDRARSTVHRCPPATSTATTPTPTPWSTLQRDKKHSLARFNVLLLSSRRITLQILSWAAIYHAPDQLQSISVHCSSIQPIQCSYSIREFAYLLVKHVINVIFPSQSQCIVIWWCPHSSLWCICGFIHNYDLHQHSKNIFKNYVTLSPEA